MPSDWVTKQPKIYTCAPTCDQCALLGFPLPDDYSDEQKAAWQSFCDEQRRPPRPTLDVIS